MDDLTREQAAKPVPQPEPQPDTDQVKARRRTDLVNALAGSDRLRFIRPGSTDVGPNERPPFGCCLLIWGA